MACCRLRIGVFSDGTGNSKESKNEYSTIAYQNHLTFKSNIVNIY